jgi:hypothetical protein
VICSPRVICSPEDIEDMMQKCFFSQFPLPLGEGEGEGKYALHTPTPHPRPLLEGEGVKTGRAYLGNGLNRTHRWLHP